MADRDPLTTAREVVREYGHRDRNTLFRRERQRLDLARAVLRAEALADRIEREAESIDLGGGNDHLIATIADDIREALKGDSPWIDRDLDQAAASALLDELADNIEGEENHA